MKAPKNEKISLVKSALYSIGLYMTILLFQIYKFIKNTLPPQALFLGSVYVPLLISCIMLILLIAVVIFRAKQERKTEAPDELADFNKYKPYCF